MYVPSKVVLWYQVSIYTCIEILHLFKFRYKYSCVHTHVPSTQTNSTRGIHIVITIKIDEIFDPTRICNLIIIKFALISCINIGCPPFSTIQFFSTTFVLLAQYISVGKLP